MSFWQITGANILGTIINIIFLIWMSGILLGRIPNYGTKHTVKCVLAALALVLTLAVVATICYLAGIWNWKYCTGMLLWQYFVLACEVLLLRLLYRTSFRNCWLDALMVEILYSYGEILAELYVHGNVYNLSVVEERRIYLFWMLVISPLCLLLCGLVIDKSGMGKVYRQWLEQEKLHKGIMLLFAFYPMFYVIIQNVMSGEGIKWASLLFPLFMLLVIHMICVYVGRDRQQKQYIMAQQASIRQQTIYIEKMEQMQSELRRFRHDFKNLMSGMYLQAKEGDLDAVQTFIQEMTGDFDRQVGGQIRLMNQLGNIHMMEVKSLFLEKLAVMQKENISCELEVLCPFEGTRMRSTDLCRCLGILLDNAMDEVRGREGAQIHLMISSQKDCTTFRIRNTLYSTVDFQRLSTAGYTTKGSGHGIGLESYRKLLEKYDFVFSYTAIQDGYFIQELKIQES